MRTEDGYIIYRCLNGDSTAFGFLVDKYKEGVYAFAYERLHNFHDAEDVAQEVFLKAYRSLRTLRHWDSFASWLYRITLNLCRGRFRTQSSRPDREFIEDQEPELLENHSRDMYRQELVCESVREALDSLPEMYSQVLTLHYLSGMTSMEIARFTGVSPSAIRKRLGKARSLLKEEMLAMMRTTFEEQKLQSTFTFRIMEAVKHIRIQPMPRTAGLPWGLSLATGIVLAILNFSPYPGILNRAATGSPLPGETRVMRTGEIPVDILRFSELPVLASKQGDGDGGEPGTSATLAAAHDEENIRTQENEKVITDPATGVEYTRTRTFTGKRDVITQVAWQLSLSPNGKFLLWNRTVIPLDDGEPFDLVDVPASRGIWSPDGKKVVFRSGGAIWVISVSSETGRPTSPMKKLLDGKGNDHWYEHYSSWSHDSERIVFEERGDKETRGDICTLSVRDGTLTRITDDPVREGRPIWSPDGKTIAYNWGEQLRVMPAEGGSFRKLIDKGSPWPISWSPDSEWLVYAHQGLRFLRLADGRELVITPPHEIGRFISWSPDGKKMLFYRTSYDWKSALKVVSASGGPSFELGRKTKLSAIRQYWSPDSKMIVTEGEGGFWIIPLAGGDPFLLELDVSVDDKPRPLRLSPDCKKLAFVVERSDGKDDLYVVPVSLKDGRTTGSAVIALRGWDKSHKYIRTSTTSLDGSWAPDGTKIAVSHEGDIWMASAEGGEPVQFTFRKRPEHYNVEPTWSPDGSMICYKVYHSEKEQILRVIPASGSENKIILDIPLAGRRDLYEWSTDSKDFVFESGGMLSAISIADGKSRQLLDLKELPIDSAWGFSWSPDRQKLAFIGYTEVEGSGDEDKYQIFMTSTEGGEFTELAADDPGEKYWVWWSPDGKWISYQSDGFVKTRPGGEIWEADVSELLSGMEKEQ